VKGLNPKFLYQDGERILIDVRRAALAGAREIEVSYDEVANKITVEVRKQLQSKKERA
jgi:hypothetical protein